MLAVGRVSARGRGEKSKDVWGWKCGCRCEVGVGGDGELQLVSSMVCSLADTPPSADAARVKRGSQGRWASKQVCK